MRRIVLGAVVLVVIAAIGAGAFIHHVLGARFQATVVPIRSFQDCVRTTQLEQQASGFQVDGAARYCQSGDPSIWFKVTVRNVGHRGAYLNTCDIRALDRDGRATLTTTVRTLWLNFPAGPYLGRGGQVFFVSPLIERGGDSVLAPPAGTIAYEVSCPPVDYHGNPPV
jgi:hypothetical protein